MYNIDSSILRRAGQAYNYFFLLGCSDVVVLDELSSIHENYLLDQCTATMMNGKRVRYSSLSHRKYEEYCNNVLRNEYNSSTTDKNAIEFLKQHFNLDVYRENIIDIRVGGLGVAVVIQVDENIFAILELFV